MDNINVIVQRMDERYLYLELRVAHIGTNLKATISEEAINIAKDSLSNIPIVGFWNGDDFEGHEYVYALEEDGNIKEMFAGEIIGAIPEANNYRIETDANGLQWVVVDGFVWRKYAEKTLAALYTGKQISMEIDIIDFVQTPKDFTINSFIYNAICILGDDRTSGITGASLKIKDQELYELKGEQMKKSNLDFSAEPVEITEPVVETTATTESEPIAEPTEFESTATTESEPIETATTEPIETAESEPTVVDTAVFEAEIAELKDIVFKFYAAEFMDVATLEEIKAMKGSATEIETQLYALRGRKHTVNDAQHYALDSTKISTQTNDDEPIWVKMLNKGEK